jgi:hypothetical protein
MEATVKKAIVAKDINHKGQGLWVTMRKLLGDFAQVTVKFLAFCLYNFAAFAWQFETFHLKA